MPEMTNADLAAKLRELMAAPDLNTVNGGVQRDIFLRNNATRLVEALEREADVATAVARERARCAAIVQAARCHEIDQDFRSIAHWIMQGHPYPDPDEERP